MPNRFLWMPALLAAALNVAPGYAADGQSATSVPSTANTAANIKQADAISEQELRDIARDTYIYAYPLVLSELTRRVMTNVEAPSSIGLGRSPMGQFAHAAAFPDETSTDAVRPNADTLYSTVWFDVSREPMVVSVPDSGGRYFVLQMADMWTDTFASPGKRVTGTHAQTLVIANAGWKGRVPDGAIVIHSPTAVGWIIGRTQTNGPSDFDAVHAFQKGWAAVPLSHYGKAYVPARGSVDPKLDMSAPIVQEKKMDAATFFPLFAELMKNNPPHANDFSILARMKHLGIEPGKGFSFDQAPPNVQQALVAAMTTGNASVEGALLKMGQLSNGWRKANTGVGTYGADYLHRALVAFVGTVANQMDDAIYPTALVDADGKPFMSDQRYAIHFTKEQIPPVKAFWSLTMYDQRQLFTANPIHRYAIGDRDKLRFNTDGSLDLYIQRESPGLDKESNWLPTPAQGRFTMNLRLYWPELTALDGSWNPPPVVHLPAALSNP